MTKRYLVTIVDPHYKKESAAHKSLSAQLDRYGQELPGDTWECDLTATQLKELRLLYAHPGNPSRAVVRIDPQE